MATPSELIDGAKEYAGTLKDDAIRALENARNWVDSVGGDNIGKIPTTFEINGITKLPPPPVTGDIPDFDQIELHLPADPTDMGPTDPIPGTDVGDAPVFTKPAPVFTKPSLPAGLREFAEPRPTVNTAFLLPVAPEKMVFDEVTFAAHSAPTRPQVRAPGEVGELPVNTAVQPGDLSDAFNKDFSGQRTTLSTLTLGYVDQLIAKHAPEHSAGMARIEAKLAEYLAGGTGLNPAVENAIYERARGKNNAEALRVRNQALNDAATRGFTLPTGALLSATQQARQAGADNNAKAAAEIVVMQAELEQKNLQFAVTASANLRTTVLNLTDRWMQGMIAVNGQALDSAKAIMGAVVQAYNLAVDVYKSKLDAWRAEVSMYEARVKIILADVEIYKSEIAALQLEYSVDQMKIDRLKAQVSQLMAYTDVYKSQVSTVLSAAELERLKVETYKSLAQAYGAEVQAKQAEWQGFSAQVSGFTAEAQAYGAETSAFGAKVQAHKAKIDGKVAEVQATAAKNQATIDEYRARVSGFTARVQAESTKNSAEIETQRQKGTLYKAKLDRATAQYSNDSTYYAAESRRILEEAREKYGAATKRAELFLELSKVTGGIYKEIGEIQGVMAGAAMAGMNSLVSMNETI